MVVVPVRRSRLIAVLRRVARARGAWPVRRRVVKSPAFSGQLFSGLIYAASCRFGYSLWTSCGVM
jgi:hypothetical protein